MSADPSVGQPLDQLAVALAAFQAEMPVVPKTHTATVKSDKGSYQYTYADLADVTAAAMPLLSKHGLVFVTLPGQGVATGGVLTGMLLHTSGQALTGFLPIGGGSPQQLGSAVTYMRRYLLGCMTGIVTDADDDGALAERGGAKRAAKAPRTAPDPSPRDGEWTRNTEAAPPTPSKPGTRGRMFALFNALEINDPDVQRAGISKVLGRAVESRAGLTEDEVQRVIRSLEARLPSPLTGDEDE